MCTRSGVSGMRLIRAPVAFLTALAIAAAVGTRPISPRPFAPYGPRGSFVSTHSERIGGISVAVGIR